MIEYGNAREKRVKRHHVETALDRGRKFRNRVMAKFGGEYDFDPALYTDRETLLPVTVASSGETILITPMNLINRKKRRVRPQFWVNIGRDGAITVSKGGKGRHASASFGFYSRETAEKIKEGTRKLVPWGTSVETLTKIVEGLYEANTSSACS